MKKYLKFKDSSKLPVIIQVENEQVFNDLEFFFGELGLSEIDKDSVAKIKLDRRRTTIASVSYAETKLLSKIMTSDSKKEVTYMPSNQYLYKNPGSAVLLYSKHTVHWQMSIVKDSSLDELKVSFNRMLTLALGKVGIVGFWGVKAQDTLLLTSKEVANGSCLFFDYENNKVYDSTTEYEMFSEFHIGRLDDSIISKRQEFSNEVLYSFLVVKNSHFSLEGITKDQRDNLLKIAYEFEYILYPESNFELSASSVNVEQVA